jgi:spectinomycin phosphotransferase
MRAADLPSTCPVLEKPDLKDERILACLKREYGLPGARVSFLPLGADRNTAVYRAVAREGTSYFLKLRGGDFKDTSVTLPKFLSEQGIEHILPPLTTTTGGLWACLASFKVILYPFVEGQNGYETRLSDHQWREFGTALTRIHTVVVPPGLSGRIPAETYTPYWRERVKTFLQRVEQDAFSEPVAMRLAAFLRARRHEILDLVGRAERLARALQAASPDLVLCHSDLHAGNLLIDAHDTFYIVDWDDPILAPKERDLMFIGGAQGFLGRTAQEEEALFYQGYGPTRIDPIALAYYRYERIVQDIAVFCEQILLTGDGGQDREQSFRYLASNFGPNGTIEVAYQSDRTRRED